MTADKDTSSAVTGMAAMAEVTRYLEANLTVDQMLAAKAKLQAAQVPTPTSVMLTASHLRALRRRLFVTSLVRIRRMYTHLLRAALHDRVGFRFPEQQ